MIWALLGLVGCYLPVKQVWAHKDLASTRDFLALMVILGAYPAVMALFHLTPFDYGLVYGLISFLPTIYFFSMARYLDVQLPFEHGLRKGLYALAAAIAVVGATNVWHGEFAVFPEHVTGAPNHLLVEEEAGWGLRALQISSAILVLSTLLLAAVQFSRARFNFTNYAIGIGMPGLAIWLTLATEHPQQLFGVPVNGFLIITTVVLASTNYSIVVRRFLEFRVVTRSTILSIMPEAMLVLSPQRYIVDANPAFETLVSAAGCGCVDERLADILPELDTAFVNADSAFEFELSRPEGRHVYEVHSQSVNRLTEDNAQVLLLLRNITAQRTAVEALEDSQRELREANAALERLSMTDTLTGLKNRRYFQDRLQAEYQRAQRNGFRLALVSIDIDHFKSINDSYGHGVGDQSLCHVARVLENECRNADTLARVGGEEFMVLLVDIAADQVNASAQRLCRRLRETPYVLESGHELRITASLGFSVLDGEDTVDSALQDADEALYAAKNAGRDQVVAAAGS